jgi:hypothetical protein
MSAAQVVLPLVWATVSSGLTGCREADEGVPGRHKGPHALRLVMAESQPKPAETRQPPQPELAFYRKYTEAMLQRYMQLSFESGRVSSLLGREFFRGNVSHCSIKGFDDVVIFVRDFDACLKLLPPGQQHLMRRIAMEGYTHRETSAMLGISLRTVLRRYAEALDRLTGMLMERKMMEPFTATGQAPVENHSALNLVKGVEVFESAQAYESNRLAPEK